MGGIGFVHVEAGGIISGILKNGECINMDIKRWMDVTEIAEYLRCSTSKIYRQVKNHEIPYRKHGHDLLFGSVEVDDWLRKGMVKPIKKEMPVIDIVSHSL